MWHTMDTNVMKIVTSYVSGNPSLHLSASQIALRIWLGWIIYEGLLACSGELR